MSRSTPAQYRRRIFVLMAAYVACLLLLWPSARSATEWPLKAMLALAPVVPVVAVIWLMAKRVVHSDELEQRVHMVALSVATGVVAVLSLVGGFLCAAGALALDGDILIWVFPALCVGYGATRAFLGRQYGGAGCE